MLFRRRSDLDDPAFRSFHTDYVHRVREKVGPGFPYPIAMRDWELYEVMRRVPRDRPEQVILETGAWSTYTGLYLEDLAARVVVSDSLGWAARSEYTGRPEITPVDVWKETLERCSTGTLDVEDIDIQRIPYPDESFDIVTSISTIEHVPDPRRALAEMYRVLAPGGRLLLTTDHSPGGVGFDGNDQFFSLEQLEELFGPYGVQRQNEPSYEPEEWCYDRTDVCIIILFVEIFKPR